MTFSRQADSPLFNIPPETRRLIYSFLFPKGILDIELCTTIHQSGRYMGRPRRLSPIAGLRQQLASLNSIKQTNGIHLLLVCQRMRIEALENLASVTVRFHCIECFNTFLPNVACGLGVGVEWMKSVEIILDPTRPNRSLQSPTHFSRYMTNLSAKAMAQETMEKCQREAWKWYGPLHLAEKEKWTFDPIKVDQAPSEGHSNVDPDAEGDEQVPVPLHTARNSTGSAAPTIWVISGKFYV